MQVTKCIFHKYGPSGSIQQHDALCVMALNIIHEKIYTVLWFWLLFLFIASTLGKFCRIFKPNKVIFCLFWRSKVRLIFRYYINLLNEGKFSPLGSYTILIPENAHLKLSN